MSTYLSTQVGSIPMQFVLEYAQGIFDLPYLLDYHGITHDEFLAISKDSQFQAAFKECKDLWSSEMSIQDRVVLKSAVLTEDSLPVLASMILNEDNPVSSRVSAIQLAAKLGKVFDKDTEGDARAISININL
jgi:nitrogen regulatory protein PII-like uncharacterized protein